MLNIFLFSFYEFGLNLFYNIFLLFTLLCVIISLWLITSQPTYKQPILAFFAFLVSVISIVYYYMMNSLDLDTATFGLYVYHMIIPFIVPTLLAHINTSYNFKPIDLSLIGYYFLPITFFLSATLFIDTELFFKSKVIIKSLGLTLVEIDTGILYALLYVYMFFGIYLCISSLIKARKHMNIDKPTFVFYITSTTIGLILHLCYTEIPFIKIDFGILFLQLILIVLAGIQIKNVFTVKSDKVIVHFIDTLENPFISLDKSYNIIAINEKGKEFAKNHFYLANITIDTLSKCNWPEFIQNYSTKNINLFDDAGIKSLRFDVKNILDNNDQILERLLIFYDNTDYINLEKKYEISLTKDSLTTTVNRVDLLKSIAEMYEKCINIDRDMSLFAIEIDDLHKVNLHQGEIAGDYVLKKTAKTISSTLRSTDVLGRYSGNVFLIIFADTSLNRAKELAESIRSKIEGSSYHYNNSKFNITISGGVVNYRTLNYTPENYTDFISLTFKNLSEAKSQGKNKII